MASEKIGASGEARRDAARIKAASEVTNPFRRRHRSGPVATASLVLVIPLCESTTTNARAARRLHPFSGTMQGLAALCVASSKPA